MFPLATIISGLSFLAIPTIAAPAGPKYGPNDLLPKDWGINCRGSGMLSGRSSVINEFITMLEEIDPDHLYKENEKIACISMMELYTTGATCLFLSDTQESLEGEQVIKLVKDLAKHGCQVAGSVPIGFGTDNNILSRGTLTSNFCEHFHCEPAEGCVFHNPAHLLRDSGGNWHSGPVPFDTPIINPGQPMYVSEEEFPVEYRYNPHEEWHYGPGITDAPIPEWRDIM